MAKTKLFPKNLRLAHSPKAFFGSLPFRLHIEFPDSKGTWYQTIKTRSYNRGSVRSQIEKMGLQKDDYGLRFGRLHATVYFKSIDHIAEACTGLLKTFTQKYQFEVSLMTEDHKEVVMNDEKVVIRPTLFFNKYAWKFEFYRMKSDDANSMLELLGEEATVDEWKYGATHISDKIRIRFGSRYYNTIVYVNDEYDAVMVKMAFVAKSITKVLLP